MMVKFKKGDKVLVRVPNEMHYLGEIVSITKQQKAKVMNNKTKEEELVELIYLSTYTESTKLDIKENIIKKFNEDLVEFESLEGLNKGYTQVAEFHDVANHPNNTESPKPMPLDLVINRAGYSVEEIVELLQASCSDKKEFLDAMHQFQKRLNKATLENKEKEFTTDTDDTLVAQVDALIDELYFAFGSLVSLGIKPDKLFTIVHEANMSKFFVDENGKPYAKYDENNKVIKAPTFSPPEEKLKEEILKQLKK